MEASKLDSTGEIDYSDSFEVEEEEVESVNSLTDISGRQKASKQTVNIPKASVLKTVSNQITRTGVETGAVSQSTSRVATQRIQTSVSASHAFTDSLQVRDAVFSEWLSRKETRMRREKSEKAEARRWEEQQIRKREVNLRHIAFQEVQLGAGVFNTFVLLCFCMHICAISYLVATLSSMVCNICRLRRLRSQSEQWRNGVLPRRKSFWKSKSRRRERNSVKRKLRCRRTKRRERFLRLPQRSGGRKRPNSW